LGNLDALGGLSGELRKSKADHVEFRKATSGAV
jgi:hypothetical protein